MKRIFLLLLPLFMTLVTAAQSHKADSVPDFAYPQTVAADARIRLDAALARGGDSPQTVRALMDIVLAQSVVDDDSLQSSLDLVEMTARKVQSPAVVAVLRLLQAQILQQAYMSRRYVYDSRVLPDGAARPANVDQWNGKMFQAEIDMLLSQAVAPETALKSRPLSQWSGVVRVESGTEPVFQTLYDFVAYRAIEMYSSFGGGYGPLPYRWLCPAESFATADLKLAPAVLGKILGLYRSLYDASPRGSAGRLYADVNRLIFVQTHSAADSDTRIYDLLASLAREDYSGSGWLPYLYLKMNDYARAVGQRREIYQGLQALSTAGLSDLMAGTRSALMANLTLPHAVVEVDRRTEPGREMQAKIKTTNACDVTVWVYRVPDREVLNFDSWHSAKVGSMKRLQRIDMHFDSDSQVFEADSAFSLKFDDYGVYALYVTTNGEKVRNDATVGSGEFIYCSSIALAYNAFEPKFNAIAVNSYTGSPLAGVTVRAYNGKNALLGSRTTSAQGIAAMPWSAIRTLRASAGDDRFAPERSVSGGGHRQKRRTGMAIFTDLPLYHLGDSVGFVAVAYDYDTKVQCVDAGTKYEFCLYDANNQCVDSISTTTDEFGRSSGRFRLPSSGLTGRFNIRVRQKGLYAGVGFEVSDYKLPTFEVKITGVERGVPEPGDVTVHAVASTFAGFPVIGAKTVLEVSAMRPYWGWRHAHASGGNAFYSAESVTAADGKVDFVVSAAQLEMSPFEGGAFSASVSVTSEAGETQSASSPFTTGKPYTISLNLPAVINLDSFKGRDAVTVSDCFGHPVAVALNYTLKTSADSVAFSGSVQPGHAVFDFASMPSGKYSVTVAPQDSLLAEAVTVSGICLYRPTDSMPPVESLLWLPETRFSAPKGGTVSVLYGTSYADSHILLTLWTEKSGIVESRWLTPGAGLHSLDVVMPSDGSTLHASLMSMRHYRFESLSFEVRPDDIATSLDVSVATMRDKMMPGADETLTISVRDNLGRGVRSAVVLDMWNMALDRIRSHSLGLSVNRNYVSGLRVSAPLYVGRISVGSRWPDFRSVPGFGMPELETYGMRFYSGMRQLRIRGRYGMMKNSATMASGTDEVLFDRVGAVAPVMMAASKVEAEAVEEAADDAVAAEPDAGGADTGNDSDLNYRPSEIPLALFAPSLTTGVDGSLNYTFRLPDANTTWRLKALAWAEDMLTGSLQRDFTVSRPVMVQSSMPRFLRVADTAELRSTVMNATDSTLSVDVTVEMFDPSTAEIFKHENRTELIPPHRSAVVTVGYTASGSRQLVGYRIKAVSGRYSDAEQDVFAILPSASDVVESTPFYISKSSPEFETTIEFPADSAQCRLSVNRNAAWQCVLALPGVQASASQTSIGAADALFSAEVARGLLRDNPAMARQLQQMFASSDSALVSNLSTNDSFKLLDLNSTPWVGAAASDNERIARLALLFDSAKSQQAVSAGLDMLKRCQRPDGGWAWMPESDRSSYWATLRVLSALGRLKQLGYFPAEAVAMTDKALAYAVRVMLEHYRPDSDIADFLLVRSRFTTEADGRLRGVIREQLRSIAAHPASTNPARTAVNALVMANYSRREAAMQALRSLSQMAVRDSVKGMWWPSLRRATCCSMGQLELTASILQAYCRMTPDAPEVEMISRWLMLQKETENWGGSSSASAVIASILSVNADYVASPSDFSVSIGGEPVAMPEGSEISTANIVIPRSADGKTLKVDNRGAAPAWGAVMTRFTASAVSTIPAAPCSDLSIDRVLMAKRGDSWEATDSFRLGDNVRILLTLRAERDIDYVTIADHRAACFEPVDQLPVTLYEQGICFYRENRDAVTDIFVEHLPKGVYQLSYEVHPAIAGSFAGLPATAQSQYAPQMSAHSAASPVTVTE